MKQQVIDRLNNRRPQFLTDLGGSIIDIDIEKGICEMEFNVSKRYCHSIDIIQGGFVTAMLDAVSSHAVFVKNAQARTISTLELKVSFYAPSRKGKLKAIGRVDKLGRSIAFLSGDLYNEANQRTASITATAKVAYYKA